MLNRLATPLLITLTGFLALTAVAGGLALVAGKGTPPLELLAGSPFSSYLVPGLCLLFLVGGLALATTVALLRRHAAAPGLVALTGLSILVFEGVEVLAIGSPRGVARNLQVAYVLLGTGLLALRYLAFRKPHPVA